MKDESGFTLVEVLVTMLMMTVVLFALYSLFDTGVRVFRNGNDRLEAIGTARTGLDRLQREVRSAYPYDRGSSPPDTRILLPSSGPTTMTFGNDLNGNFKVDTSTEEISYRVVSSATNAICTSSNTPCKLERKIGTGSGSYEVLANGLVYSDGGTTSTDDDVAGAKFVYLNANGTTETSVTNAKLVRMTLIVRKGNTTQRLTTDVALRNSEP